MVLGAHCAGLAVLCKFAVAIVNDNHNTRAGGLDDGYGLPDVSDAQRRPKRVPARALDEGHAQACIGYGIRAPFTWSWQASNKTHLMEIRTAVPCTSYILRQVVLQVHVWEAQMHMLKAHGGFCAPPPPGLSGPPVRPASAAAPGSSRPTPGGCHGLDIRLCTRLDTSHIHCSHPQCVTISSALFHMHASKAS